MQTEPRIARIIGSILVGSLLFASLEILGQTPQSETSLPPVVHLTAEQDHQRLLDLLHISSLRRGPDGDPKSPNAANYDESRATTYKTIPDPLVLNDGKKVTTPKIWWEKRRPEIVESSHQEIPIQSGNRLIGT